ncbi:MAG TPA: SBBP repeat-containing protein, partial [Candidatus Binatia bacterium]|nr:SBBP repeat-containing protein [Candidatus Binatia bacterium]
MKRFSVSRFAAAAALFVGTALLAVSPAFAGNPLNAPRGLAVAANGDLYVANQSGNSILVFNPSYQYLPAKTITAGIDKPSGVAIDPLGNIYVSNWTDGEVTVYSSTGVQNVNSTISGLNAPQGIAVDSIGNIYVDENYQDVRVYGATTVGKSTPVLVSTYNPGQDIFSIAAHNQLFGWGGL